MWEFFLRLVGGLVPLHNADSETQFRYQLRLGLTVSVIIIWLIGVTVDAFGLLPGWSQGFALATDVQKVVTEIRQNRVQTIDNQVLELRLKHCQAKSDEARQLYWAKIAALQTEYQVLTVRAYLMPRCEDL